MDGIQNLTSINPSSNNNIIDSLLLIKNKVRNNTPQSIKKELKDNIIYDIYYDGNYLKFSVIQKSLIESSDVKINITLLLQTLMFNKDDLNIYIYIKNIDESFISKCYRLFEGLNKFKNKYNFNILYSTSSVKNKLNPQNYLKFSLIENIDNIIEILNLDDNYHLISHTPEISTQIYNNIINKRLSNNNKFTLIMNDKFPNENIICSEIYKVCFCNDVRFTIFIEKDNEISFKKSIILDHVNIFLDCEKYRYYSHDYCLYNSSNNVYDIKYNQFDYTLEFALVDELSIYLTQSYEELEKIFN